MSKKALVDRMVKYLFENCDDPNVLYDLDSGTIKGYISYLCENRDNPDIHDHCGNTFADRVDNYLYHTFDKLFYDKNHSASPEGAAILAESPEFVEFWSKIYDSHNKHISTSLARLNKISYAFRDAIGFIKYCYTNRSRYHVIDRYSTFKHLDLIGRDDDGCGYILMTKFDSDVSRIRHEAFLEKYKFTESFVNDVIDSIHGIIYELHLSPLDRSDVRFIVREAIKVYLSHKDQSPEVIRYLDTIKYDFEEYDFLTYYAL